MCGTINWHFALRSFLFSDDFAGDDADLPRNRVFDVLLLTFFEEKICALSKAEFFLPNIRN